MRILASLPALLLLTYSLSVYADSFEIQGGYRASSQDQKWKGGEFQAHYLSEDFSSFSFGAYFSSNTWTSSEHKKAQLLEGGPEVRWQYDQEKRSWFAALQYAALSSGRAQFDPDVGIRVQGPRLLAGVVLPVNDLIFNLGLTKGFETITYYGDDRKTDGFSSWGAFVGFSL